MKPSFRPRRPEVPIIVTDPLMIGFYLRRIGVTLEELERAFVAAQRARAEWTPDHSPTAKGTGTHDAAVAELRRLLRRRKWRIVNEQNQALALHPKLEIAVMVANGDLATGSVDADPRTRAAKGKRTKRAVMDNQRQSSFAEVLPSFTPPKRETWILLIWINPETDSASVELSQPQGFDQQGRVSKWACRLILDDALQRPVLSATPPSPHDWRYPARIEIDVRSKRSGTN